MSKSEIPKTSSNKTDKNNQGKIILNLLYLQAIFLSSAYAIGVWQTLIVQQISLTSPYIIGHAFMAGGFAVISGTIGLLALFQNLKQVSNYNFALFLLAILGGATGLSFLGDQASSLRNIVNLSMITVIGLGIPITVFSIIQVLKRLNPNEKMRNNRAIFMGYLSLGTLSIHLFTGVGTISTHYYSDMLIIHRLFAGLTAVLVSIALVLSFQEKIDKNISNSIWRISYLALALIFIVLSAVTGATFLNLGKVDYLVSMAEVAILAYGLIVLGMRELYEPLPLG